MKTACSAPMIVAVSFLCLFTTLSQGAVLNNPDFETGTLSGWVTRVNKMSIAARTNETFNRNYAAAITGRYSSATWITNAISQTFNVVRGDNISVEGYVYWNSYTEQAAAATGYVQAILKGDFGSTQSSSRAVWSTTNSWSYFKLANLSFGTLNSGFEEPLLESWAVGCDHLTAYDNTGIAASGSHSMRMVGAFTNWSWNQAYQVVNLKAGDVVRGKAKMRVDLLASSGDWLVAGIKLEKDGGGQGMESVKTAPYNTTSKWADLTFTMACTQSGAYVYRCMVAGGNGGTSQADVYFDDVTLGPTSTIVQAVSVELAYVAHSGGASFTSSAAVYLDSLTLKGSSANLVNPTNILTTLRNEARTIGTNAAALIPAVVYPKLNAYGEPGTNRFPGSIEAAFAGWKFKYLTNNVTIQCTNTITMYELSTNGQGYIEFDQYIYCGKNPNKKRGEPLEIRTNSPYFVLGTKDGRSTEFGSGPFQPAHTYVVGTSLTNFPRRMTTDASGGWPSRLNIVFNENFKPFTNSLWNKHFVINGVITNGAQTGVKALKIGLTISKTGASNDVEALTQEIHMGWASEAQCHGLVDYPNLTYQDHNEVALRAPWIYNLVDDGTGWYMQQSPRGNATIEPLDLFALNQTNWLQQMYDEVFFTWSHAASGVRSLFDDDTKSRLKGPVAYHVGVKIGHSYGTNDLGESNYPEVLNIRGNGYFRMTDYDGVMAGSFRPMASDIFGLYKGKKNEDAPLITKSYTRVVPRTTATNLPDNSYGQVFSLIRSKTNQFFIGCMKQDLHFAPQEVGTNGCYFDMEAETWANKANVITQHGPFALFSQVSMHWRGGADINDGAEGHDIDCIMVKKADGEWVTHQVLNPPTNVSHRTLTSFQSNDTVYLQQQDRGHDSYGFATEAPYKRASSFEITMLNDGGLPLNLDVYEEHATSEINDNINIACNVRSNLALGQNLKYQYRYRTVYAPGVCIISPNESSGAENWSNDSYRIEFYATDGHEFPLTARIYYGNGKDSDWRLINTNVVLYVPTNTHKIAYDWSTANVATGAYYIKVTAQRTTGGKVGFDVSNTRLQVGRTRGLQNNGTVQSSVITNTASLGTNLSFETGTASGWVPAADHLAISVTNTYTYEGSKAARMSGSWSGWSWNNLRQDIACRSGEVLHITGKVRIQSLAKGGANWVGVGVKLESASGGGSVEQSFNETSATNTWLSVDLYRTTAGTTERLILWVAGNDCPNANVYFDDFRIISTNGVLVTNSVHTGYWVSTSPVNVAAHNVLSFFVRGTNSGNETIWAADFAGVTNSLKLSNYVSRVVSTDQRVDVPWAHFMTVGKTNLKAVGFSSTSVFVSRMRSFQSPLIVASQVRPAPQSDAEGLPHYYPGQVMTNVITLTNLFNVALTGLTVQAVQEYAETRTWWDGSPHVEPRSSDKCRRGDRLAGGFEQVWVNRTIPARGRLILTNVYVNPLGRLVPSYYSSNDAPWYAFRNVQSRAQVHVVVRRANGDNVYDNDGAGCYGVDEDSTMTNNTLLAGASVASPLSLLESKTVVVADSQPAGGGGAAVNGATDSNAPIPETKTLTGGAAALVPQPAFSCTADKTKGTVLFRSLPFLDNFEDGHYTGWKVPVRDAARWSVTEGKTLKATGNRSSYTYALIEGLSWTNQDVSVAYNVLFDGGAAEGGLIYKGQVLYVNPTVCGWNDRNPRFVVGCPLLSTGAWHRVVLDIRAGDPLPTSDLYIDDIPVFFDEPVEPAGNNLGTGFLSPYFQGAVQWDEVEILGW